MSKRKIYLENAGWLKELRDQAVHQKRWFEAYLLTFFRIEIALILLIDRKMTTTGEIEYSDEFLEKISAGRLHFAELVNIFCLLYGDELFKGLDTVRKERNDFIHNFYKKLKIDFEKYVEDIYTNALLVEMGIAQVIHE